MCNYPHTMFQYGAILLKEIKITDVEKKGRQKKLLYWT